MSTSVKIIGGAPSSSTVATPGVEQIVDPTFGASRVRLCPVDYIFQGRVLGHYRLAGISGPNLTGILNAAGNILSFRWTNINTIAVIERITVGFSITVTSGASQIFDADAIIGRNYTTVASGGTILIPQTVIGTNRVRTTMNASLVNDVRIASTTTLGAGTVTLDANAFASSPVSKSFTIGQGDSTDLYSLTRYGQHPLIISTNEGFFVRLVTAWNNANQGNFYITIEWAEVVGY